MSGGRKFLFGGLLFVMAVASVLGPMDARRAPGQEYVSEWTALEPGEFAEFEHGLGGRPVHLMVWAAVWILPAREGALSLPPGHPAKPWTEQEGLRVVVVDGEQGGTSERERDRADCGPGRGLAKW